MIPLPDKDASPGTPAHISAYQEFPTGATVMALYPDTSCFYRAEVVASPKDIPTQGRVSVSDCRSIAKSVRTATDLVQNSGTTYYKLKFEDDDDQEHMVSTAEVVEWPGQ
jgi:SAGA-associated factor 29